MDGHQVHATAASPNVYWQIANYDCSGGVIASSNNIGGYTVTSAAQCIALCESVGNCIGFSLNLAASGKNCWLKGVSGSVNQLTSCAAVTTGYSIYVQMTDDFQMPGYYSIPNFDCLYDGDISNTAFTTLTACGNSCSTNTAGCIGVAVWSGRCYLKNSVIEYLSNCQSSSTTSLYLQKTGGLSSFFTAAAASSSSTPTCSGSTPVVCGNGVGATCIGITNVCCTATDPNGVLQGYMGNPGSSCCVLNPTTWMPNSASIGGYSNLYSTCPSGTTCPTNPASNVCPSVTQTATCSGNTPQACGSGGTTQLCIGANNVCCTSTDPAGVVAGFNAGTGGVCCGLVAPGWSQVGTGYYASYLMCPFGSACVGTSKCVSNAGTVAVAAASTSSGSSCFASTEQVTLESGHTKAMADVQVGDRVLTVNAKGEQVFSDVVYLPHGRNEEQTTFAQIATESGRDLKMTMNHYLPAGACALSTLPLVTASQITAGDCVQTVSGREQVVSVGKIEGKGIYTVIAMEELIVVNGIVTTPYGGINPTLVNIYYNLHRLAYTAFAGKMVGHSVLQKATEGLWSSLTALAALSA